MENKIKAGTKIIIVEDDKLLGGLLSKMLTSEGCNVRYVENGSIVLASAEAEKPDLIILDLLLPGTSGFGVLDLLKKNILTKDVPVIILSCLGEEEEIKKGFSLGAVSYLVKSTVTVEAIINEVSRVLRILN
jgi:DNA-binding response OmpR family regulator